MKRMPRFTKFMTCALAAIMMIAMFAGTVVASEESQSPITGEPLKFSIIDNNLDIADYTKASVWQEICAKANVEIEFISAEGNYDEKISLLYMSGDLPDLFYTAMDTELEKRATAKFTIDEFKEYMPNLYESTLYAMESLGVNQETTWKRYLVDGTDDTIFGVPGIWYEGQLGHGITWRLDLLKEMGFNEVPTTIEEMEEVFKAWKELHPEWYAYGSNKETSRMFDVVFNATGNVLLRWMLVDDKLVPGWVRPENAQALETLQRWYELGYIDREFMTKEDWTDSDAFNNGRSIVQAWAEIGKQVSLVKIEGGFPNEYDALLEINPGAELVAGPLPVYSEGQYAGAKPAVHAWRAFHGNTVGFSYKLEDDRDRLHAIMQAWDYISTDLYELVWYGIEEIHYERDENGELEYIGPYTEVKARNNEGIGSEVLRYNFKISQQFPYSSKYKIQALNDYYLDSNAIYSVNNVTPIPSGVSTIYDEEGNDLSAKYADLINMRDVIFMEIISGQKPVSAYYDYIETWKNNGGEELEYHANRLYRHLY